MLDPYLIVLDPASMVDHRRNPRLISLVLAAANEKPVCNLKWIGQSYIYYQELSFQQTIREKVIETESLPKLVAIEHTNKLIY